MLKKIDNCGTGLNADLTPEELGDGVWTAVSNVRFNNGYAERFKGTTQAFTTPSVTPYFIAPYATSTKRFWLHAGLAAVYVDDGTTRTDITGSAPTGAIDNRWSGGSINGVWVMNNGVDVPMYWNGDTGTNLATIPGWNANWRADVICPFKSFIIALGITKSGTKYPHMVKWCTELGPGAITSAGDWDETDPDLDAGEQDLAETSDLIVDALPLGDTLIVYKERSMYSVTYSGSPYIFRFNRIPGEVGMLARGCGVSTPFGHVVLTAGDVVLNTGQSCPSIANGIVRKLIFNSIDSTNYKRAFVTANPQRNEVWICLPVAGGTTCTRAAVWNWVDKSWAIRELSNVTYGAFGQIDIAATGLTYDTTTATYDTSAVTYSENEYSPAEARLLMCHSTPLISLADTGTTDFGALISAYAERTGMTLGDSTTVKTVRGIRWQIDGNAGATITIQVGASMFPDASPNYGPAQTFTIGSEFKTDHFVTGRYIAIRISNSDYSPWRLKTFIVDYTNAGGF